MWSATNKYIYNLVPYVMHISKMKFVEYASTIPFNILEVSDIPIWNESSLTKFRYRRLCTLYDVQCARHHAWLKNISINIIEITMIVK